MSYEEENNYAAIVTSVNSISVPEGGKATFNVRLSRPPQKGRAKVSIVPSGGNADINVAIGSELVFKRKDFNQ